jgi:hypothetical protein
MMLEVDGRGPVYDLGMWLSENGPELLRQSQDPAVLWPYVLWAVICLAVGLAMLRLRGRVVDSLRSYLSARPAEEITLGKRREKGDRLIDPSVRVSFDDRCMGVQVVAPTGQGKTTLFKDMILQDLYRGRTVFVLETDGDLGPELLAYAGPSGVGDRFFYFDPTNLGMKWNPLKGPVARVAEQAVDTIESAAHGTEFYKDFNADVMRNMVHAAHAYACSKGDYPTLRLVQEFLADRRSLVEKLNVRKDEESRYRVLAPFVGGETKVWFEQEFFEWSERIQREFTINLRNLLRRLLSTPETIEALTPRAGEDDAPADFEIDLRRALSTGGLIVFRIPSNPLGSTTSQTIATWVLQHLQQETLGRPKEERTPLCVYLDEVHVILGHHNTEVASSFSRWITRVRNYRVATHLAYQSFSQLPRELKNVLATNARNKLISGGLYGQDARDAQDLLGHSLQEVEDIREQERTNFLTPRRRSRGSRMVEKPRYTLEEIEKLPLGQWFYKGVKRGRQTDALVLEARRPQSPDVLEKRVRERDRRRKAKKEGHEGRRNPTR